MNWEAELPEITAKLGADLILQGGKVITVDESDFIAEAVAIKYARADGMKTFSVIKEHQTSMI